MYYGRSSIQLKNVPQKLAFLFFLSYQNFHPRLSIRHIETHISEQSPLLR